MDSSLYTICHHTVLSSDQRCCLPRLPRSCRTANSMEIVNDGGREVKEDDMIDKCSINTSGRNVCTDEHLVRRVLFKQLECFLSVHWRILVKDECLLMLGL